MIPRNSWICVLAVSAAMAQSGGYTLLFSNASQFPPSGKAAPGSRAFYWLQSDSNALPDNWSSRPTLTLTQSNHPPIPLETTGPSVTIGGVVLLPENLDEGPAVLTLTADNVHASATIEIVASAPLIYSSASPRLTLPARAGDSISILGTGLGNATAAEVRASLGTQSLTVLAAGRSANERNMDRYIVAIPADATLPDDCYTPLHLTVRGVTMPAGHLATSPRATGPCRHPWDLTPAQLHALDIGGVIPVATFTMSTSASPATTTISGSWASTQIGRYERANIEIRNMTAQTVASVASVAAPVVGCSHESRTALIPTGIRLVPFRPNEPPPSLGGPVRLTGPTGSYVLARQPETQRSYYEAILQQSEPADYADYYDQLPPSVWTLVSGP